jgi:hypothetical protein
MGSRKLWKAVLDGGLVLPMSRVLTLVGIAMTPVRWPGLLDLSRIGTAVRALGRQGDGEGT